MVPATQAASRLTMNSKPSLEMRVTKGEVEGVVMLGHPVRWKKLRGGVGCGANSRGHVTSIKRPFVSYTELPMQTIFIDELL